MDKEVNRFPMFLMICLIFGWIATANAEYFPLKDSVYVNEDNTSLKEIEEKEESSTTNSSDKPDQDEYNDYTGKIIRKINIVVFDVAGPSVEEDSNGEKSFFGKIGEALHLKTKDWVVKNILLFNEGDKLDPALLYESERLLRTGTFAVDANLRVVPLEHTQDSVDIRVVSKDKWTMYPMIAYNAAKKSSYIGLKDENFVGFGHLLDVTFTHDENKYVGSGTSLKYIARNIFGYYFDVGLVYNQDKQKDIKSFQINRDFFSLETDFAGGVGTTLERNNMEFLQSDRTFSLIPYRYFDKDLWIGKSFKLDFFKIFSSHTRFLAAARYNNRVFDRIPTDQSLNPMFANSNRLLFKMGFLQKRYYEEHFVNAFGHTEDIPVGFLLSFTGGYESNSIPQKRWYSEIKTVASRRIYNFGYISANVLLSSYRNINRWEQTMFDGEIVFHSILWGTSDWKYRLLMNGSYTAGFKRAYGEQIYLDTERRLRGYPRFSFFGNKRLLFNAEQRVYSPFKPLGFLIAGIVYTDLGFVNSKRSVFSGQLYQTYGAGIKLSNEQISRTTFEISVAFTPSAQSKKSNFAILFTSTLILGFKEYTFEKPGIAEFK